MKLKSFSSEMLGGIGLFVCLFLLCAFLVLCLVGFLCVCVCLGFFNNFSMESVYEQVFFQPLAKYNETCFFLL